VLDASSKAANDWQLILNYINTVAANFNVNPQCVRMAVIRYATSAQVAFSLSTHNNINSVQQAVRSLTLLGGTSNNLAGALQLLRTQVFPSNVVRSGARLIALIVTDRLQPCSSQIITEANNVKRMGVFVVGVGINQNRLVDSTCMRRVVSCNYIVAPAYNQLRGQILTQTVQYICAATCVSKYHVLVRIGSVLFPRRNNTI